MENNFNIITYELSISNKNVLFVFIFPFKVGFIIYYKYILFENIFIVDKLLNYLSNIGLKFK